VYELFIVLTEDALHNYTVKIITISPASNTQTYKQITCGEGWREKGTKSPAILNPSENSVSSYLKQGRPCIDLKKHDGSDLCAATKKCYACPCRRSAYTRYRISVMAGKVFEGLGSSSGVKEFLL
jgi:hypothetical protein